MTRTRFAFTVIELLAVIAIIAVLAAMLMPAITYVRASAQRVVCAHNLSQIGLTVAMYANDWENYIPAAQVHGDDDADTSPAWFYRLPPYADRARIGTRTTAFQCASFRWAGPKVFANATPKSLKMNQYLDHAWPEHYALGQGGADAGNLVLFIDGKAGETGVGQWGHCPTTAVDDERHHGCVNILYADSHTCGVGHRPADGKWKNALVWMLPGW